jgi:membrane protein implicated in regulation of membrane protease activity
MTQGPIRIQWIYQNSPRRNWFQLLIGAVTLALLLFFGVWLFMIAATLLVLALPYFWWKKRKLMAKMAQMQQEYAYQQAKGASPTDTSHAGVVIDGEIIEGKIVESSTTSRDDHKPL